MRWGCRAENAFFPTATQALVNPIDHGMSLQEAMEAPRVFTEGDVLEAEGAIAEPVRAALRAKA